MTSLSLTLGPAQGDLLLHTTVEGRAARMGHALTLRVRSWSCVADLEDGTPLGARIRVDLASLEVLRGEGGLKPLTDADKRKIVSSAQRALGDGRAEFVSTSVEPRWLLHGSLALHGVTRAHTVEVRLDGSRLSARTSVRQSDFGIVPYSQAQGALRVGDVVQVLASVVVPDQA